MYFCWKCDGETVSADWKVIHIHSIVAMFIVNRKVLFFHAMMIFFKNTHKCLFFYHGVGLHPLSPLKPFTNLSDFHSFLNYCPQKGLMKKE